MQRPIGALTTPDSHIQRSTYNTRQTHNEMLGIQYMEQSIKNIGREDFKWVFKMSDETDRATPETGKSDIIIYISVNGGLFFMLTLDGYTHDELAAYTHDELAAYTHAELMGALNAVEIGSGWYYMSIDYDDFPGMNTMILLAECLECANADALFNRK